MFLFRATRQILQTGPQRPKHSTAIAGGGPHYGHSTRVRASLNAALTNAVTDNAPHAGWRNYNFIKISLWNAIFILFLAVSCFLHAV